MNKSVFIIKVKNTNISDMFGDFTHVGLNNYLSDVKNIKMFTRKSLAKQYIDDNIEAIVTPRFSLIEVEEVHIEDVKQFYYFDEYGTLSDVYIAKYKETK